MCVCAFARACVCICVPVHACICMYVWRTRFFCNRVFWKMGARKEGRMEPSPRVFIVRRDILHGRREWGR